MPLRPPRATWCQSQCHLFQVLVVTAPLFQGPYCAPAPIMHNKLPQAWSLRNQCSLCSQVCGFYQGSEETVSAGVAGRLEKTPHWGLDSPAALSLTRLAIDAGCWLGPQLGLLARAPAHGLSMWLLGCLPTWWRGAKGSLPGDKRRSKTVVCLQHGICTPLVEQRGEVCSGSRRGHTGQTLR